MRPNVRRAMRRGRVEPLMWGWPCQRGWGGGIVAFAGGERDRGGLERIQER